MAKHARRPVLSKRFHTWINTSSTIFSPYVRRAHAHTHYGTKHRGTIAAFDCYPSCEPVGWFIQNGGTGWKPCRTHKLECIGQTAHDKKKQHYVLLLCLLIICLTLDVFAHRASRPDMRSLLALFGTTAVLSLADDRKERGKDAGLSMLTQKRVNHLLA